MVSVERRSYQHVEHDKVPREIQNISKRPRDFCRNTWNDRHESTEESKQDEVRYPSSSEIDPIGILVHLRWIWIRWLCLADNFCCDHLEK